MATSIAATSIQRLGCASASEKNNRRRGINSLLNVIGREKAGLLVSSLRHTTRPRGFNAGAELDDHCLLGADRTNGRSRAPDRA